MKATPDSPFPGVIHGDYRLENTVLDANDPGRILAILDWEMSTVGDPLTDIGLLVVYWTDYGEVKPFRFVTTLAHPGLRKDELADVYAAAGGRGAESLDFYVVNGYYKLAVILEGIYARFLQGKPVGEDDLSLAGADVPVLARIALDIAARSSIRGLRGQS